MSLGGKTLFISGGSRGIGLAIALRAARDGANVTIAAKTAEPNPKLPGTIYTAAEEIEKAGGKALPVVCDIRDEGQVAEAVARTVQAFGGIDICVNNASAIQLAGTLETDMKRFDLMHDINVRGTFLVTKHCVPHFLKSKNPHILTLSPPVDLAPKWLGAHVAYTLSKYNMTLLAMGWAEEFKQDGIAANSLWPVTTIATAAVNNLLGGEYLMQRSRTTDIIADAVFYIMQQKATAFTGRQLLDEEVLKESGITDFSGYAVNPANGLQKDLFL